MVRRKSILVDLFWRHVLFWIFELKHILYLSIWEKGLHKCKRQKISNELPRGLVKDAKSPLGSILDTNYMAWMLFAQLASQEGGKESTQRFAHVILIILYNHMILLIMWNKDEARKTWAKLNFCFGSAEWNSWTSFDWLMSKGVLPRVGNVEETVLVLVLLVQFAHCPTWLWHHFVDE